MEPGPCAPKDRRPGRVPRGALNDDGRASGDARPPEDVGTSRVPARAEAYFRKSYQGIDA